MMMHPRFRFTVTLFSAATLVACSLGGPLREDQKASSYRIGALPGGWEKAAPDTARVDQAFLNRAHGSLIAVSSVCKRYDLVSLPALTKELLSPIDAREVTQQETQPLDGRESLHTRARGKMDGVPVEASFVVVRKDDCIFDFSLVSRDPIQSDDAKAFEGLVKAFHYGGPAAPGGGNAK